MGKYFITVVLILFLVCGCRKSPYTIEQTNEITDLGGGTGSVTWTNDKTYILDGFVFVNDGQTLTIEPGTVIRARTGQGSLSSALIVARGGKIIAEGTRTDPIIFTVEGDDLKGSIPLEASGLWGGVIILGNAPVNTDTGEDMVEGIPISEPRGVYGGIDENDNSGIFRFVSIRHGGTNIGEGNEINGLTLGGVGRKTIIDHVEVIANEDDGVEIFGGTVNLRNLAISFCGDDAIDIDQGYNGRCQFIFCIENASSDHAIECSAGLQPLQFLPDVYPHLYNLTLIGSRGNNSVSLIDFHSYGAAHIMNSVFIYTGAGISLSCADRVGDVYSLFANGSLTVENNVYYNEGENTELNIYCYNDLGDTFELENSILRDSLSSWQNTYGNPLEISSDEVHYLPDATVFSDLAPYQQDWFEKVTYKGAFGSEDWLENWALIYQYLNE